MIDRKKGDAELKKLWVVPTIESIDLGLTENDVNKHEIPDGILAGQLGDNPQGWECPDECS